jgi:hypothetical protein
MAKRGGGGGLAAFVGVVAITGALYYLVAGRGNANALLIPDALENRIDRVVAALNQKFGGAWVEVRLDQLQAYIQQAAPGLATLVEVVYGVERQFKGQRNLGTVKKQAAVKLAKRLGR